MYHESFWAFTLFYGLVSFLPDGKPYFNINLDDFSLIGVLSEVSALVVEVLSKRLWLKMNEG